MVKRDTLPAFARLGEGVAFDTIEGEVSSSNGNVPVGVGENLSSQWVEHVLATTPK